MRATNVLEHQERDTATVGQTLNHGFRDDHMPPAERRVVTVLFCDVVGSTGMAEFLDPEEWADLMNEVFDRIIGPIERYDGTVTRLIGDAVMAIFGAPQAHADDPKRAILTGLDIIKEIEELCQRIQRRHGFDFNVRIGINTGLAVVGAFGAASLVEYTAMGDVTNVAARIQTLAAPGTIEVGEKTYQLTQGSFKFEPRGTHEVRGKSQPERTFRVAGRIEVEQASTECLFREMPFTGRKREMQLLCEAIDDLRRDGRGRIIAIHGESGVGKSRLVKELVQYAQANESDDGLLPLAVLENEISPYEMTRPYSALQSRFQRVYGITPEDAPAIVHQKLEQSSQRFPPDLRERAARVIQRVMALRSVEASDFSEFERDGFRSEVSVVARQLMTSWNPDGALIFIGEDYHWMDSASMGIVSDLYDLTEELPILFLSTFRPEHDTPAMRAMKMAREHYPDQLLEINLQPLPAADADELLQRVIQGDDPAAENLRLLIRARAEGNPLFVEELLKGLADNGTVELLDGDDRRWQMVETANLTSLSLPTSIQALLLERVDRLDPDAKRILQYAAVLGRRFSKRVLSAVIEADAALGDQIQTLIGADLIRRSTESSSDAFEFRHSMIQDAAYETILLRHRREIHRRAAESMEKLYAGRETEFASVIGNHYFESGDQRAVDWLVRAAIQARTVYEPETVVDFASKAIAFASDRAFDLPAAAYQARGHAHDALGDYEAARADFATVLGIAREREERELEWQALIDLGALWSESDYARAEPLIQESLTVAQALGDRTKIAHSLNRLGNWQINVGRPAAARDAHQEAMSIFEQTDNMEGLAETLDLLGMALYMMADFSTSASTYRQAIELFKARGDHRGLASSLTMLALTGGDIDHETAAAAAGSPEQWIDYAHDGLAMARQIGWRAGEAFALMIGGTVAAYHGNLREGLQSVRQAEALATKLQHHQWTLGAKSIMGAVAFELLQWDEALELLTFAKEMSQSLGSVYWKLSADAHLADLHLAAGRIDDAEAILSAHPIDIVELDCLGSRKLVYRAGRLALAKRDWNRALSVGDRLMATAPGADTSAAVPGLALLRGQALLGLGESDQAASELFEGALAAERAANLLMQWRLQLALSIALRGSGNDDEAARVLRTAQATIDQISGQLEGDPWQRLFLNRSREIVTRTQREPDQIIL